MKTSHTERAALARKPISPDHQRYEAVKQRWIAEHPHATPAQYDAAMKRIAKACRV